MGCRKGVISSGLPQLTTTIERFLHLRFILFTSDQKSVDVFKHIVYQTSLSHLITFSALTILRITLYIYIYSAHDDLPIRTRVPSLGDPASRHNIVLISVYSSMYSDNREFYYSISRSRELYAVFCRIRAIPLFTQTVFI
jgi:hypothetical protein